MIKMFKSAVRRLTSYDGTDWPSLCPQIQFAYNNSLHTTTGFRPYYLAFGFLPVTFPLFSVRPSLPLATAFDNYHKHIELAHQLISSSTSGASHRYNNAHSSPPTYSVGDKVWLDREGITGPADSNIRLSFRQPFLGPFSILAVDTVLDNITLDLPATMRVHNVFHVSSIKPWRDPSSHFPARTVPTEPPPEIIADHEEFEVEEILDYKTTHHGTRFKFLIRWKGYGREHDQWESPTNLTGCRELLQGFLDRNPRCTFRFPASGTSARGGVRVTQGS